MERKVILSEKAPQPIGPYSQAILSGQTLYISGQIALDPVTGHLVMDSIQSETKQVMKNLEAILTAAGLTFSHVVKTTIFITNMNDFAAINEIYGSFFNQDPPARETVQVAGLPKGVHIEISMIAVKP